MKILSINRAQRLVFLDDGSQTSMINFVDRFGDDTDDVFDATGAIAPLPDGTWLVIDLTKFETVSRH